MTTLQALIGSSAVPVVAGNFLRVQANGTDLGGNTVTIRALVLGKDGDLQWFLEELPLTNATTEHVELIPLQPGLLLQASADANGSNVTPGQLYAQIGIQFNAIAQNKNILKLTSGFISDGQFLAFPYTEPTASNSQSTPATLYNPTNPPAGGDLGDVIASTGTTLLNGFNFRFTASAVAANRRITILIDDGGGWNGLFRTRTDITANEVWTVMGWNGPNMPDDDTVANYMYFPLSAGIHFANTNIGTQTANIDAGDQIDQIFVTYTNTLAI